MNDLCGLWPLSVTVTKDDPPERERVGSAGVCARIVQFCALPTILSPAEVSRDRLVACRASWD
jgi:hypothetical protein